MTPPPEGPLILVIEDDLGLAELIREELSLRGWAFLHAPTGQEALAFLATRRPDLVLLDFSLPDMTALQILEKGDLPPFIVTTGSGDERIAVEMMKKGALDYLVKDAHFLGALPGAVERALHSAGVERDLAEAQARLKAADESLRNAQKMESLGRMAGGIAHDFNNLFQTIQGNLELAVMRGVEAQEGREALVRALRILKKASALAQQMLDFSGRGFRRSEAVDLDRMVEEALEGQPDIRYEGGAGLPPVEGDPEQLCQVLKGLVANAREALGPDSDPIRISTGVLDPRGGGASGGVWISQPPLQEAMVCLTVEDSGSGMAKEVLDRAFDPFFSTHHPGRGMGLSVALGILKGHSAGLWVRTAPGEGTTFRVVFPAMHQASPDVPVPRDGRAAGRKALLLVEDDEDLRETMAEFLGQDLGYPVLQARDGLEAVEVYRREGDGIGLILMDATMPRMAGPDAFRLIRDLDPGARGVLCSGFSEEAGSRVAQEFGFEEFLKKPFSLGCLQENITRLLGS